MHLPSNFLPSPPAASLSPRFYQQRASLNLAPNRSLHSSPADRRVEGDKRPLRRRRLPGREQPRGSEAPDYARQYLIEHPEFDPQSNPVARPLPREAATTAVRRETQAEPPAAKQNATRKSTTTDPAAERRKNAAYGASRGTEAKNNPAPKERKKPRDPSSDKVENSKEYVRIQQAEAAIPGTMAGNWRDLRTVFELAGIREPSKQAPTASESAASEPR
jgi:hypothetical protein